MHAAFMNGHVDVAEWLKAQGAQVTGTTQSGAAPQHLAIARGQVEVLRWFLENAFDSTQTRAHEEMLDMAQSSGHAEIVEMLQKWV
eukprot:2876630-Amphidinium_carterae.2